MFQAEAWVGPLIAASFRSGFVRKNNPRGAEHAEHAEQQEPQPKLFHKYVEGVG
jgi:hypothetical protein